MASIAILSTCTSATLCGIRVIFLPNSPGSSAERVRRGTGTRPNDLDRYAATAVPKYDTELVKDR